MPFFTLRSLYLAELNDLYDGERQLLLELPLMAASATSAELRTAFDAHYRQTQQHVTRLERLFRQMDERPRQEPCRALRVIIECARARNGSLDRGDVLDAGLIGAAQRMEHYEIAGYGCARSYASTLGELNAAELLQQTLDEEGSMDLCLAQLAERVIGQRVGESSPAVRTPTSLMTHMVRQPSGILRPLG